MKNLLLILVLLFISILPGCILDDWFGNENEPTTPVTNKYVTIHVDVPDIGTAKLALKTNKQNAIVYLIPEGTPKANMGKKNDSWQKLTTDANGDCTFDVTWNGQTRFTFGIDVNGDGIFDDFIIDVEPATEKTIIKTSYIKKNNPFTDGSWLDVKLDKVVYKYEETITATVTGYMAAAKNISIQVRNEKDDYDYYTSATQSLSADISTTYTKLIPSTWPTTNSNVGSDYKCFATDGTNILGSDNFNLLDQDGKENEGDTDPPNSGSIVINGGDAKTDNLTVTLTLNVTDATKMMFSNSSSFTGMTWETYVTSKTWTMASGLEGTRTVIVKFSDDIGNVTTVFSDTIEYDLTVVSNIAIAGNSGDITITYDLADVDNDNCSIQVFYQGGAVGTTWTAATVTGTTSGLGPGTGKTVIWNSATDQSGQKATDYKIRITPNDGTTDGTYGESSTFSVDNNVDPTIAVVQPDGVSDTADTAYKITWTDFDSDNDATISLYYDTDTIPGGEVLIVSGLSENADGENGSYTWNASSPNPITGVADGDYYISVKIDDGVNAVIWDYSDGPVTISRIPGMVYVQGGTFAMGSILAGIEQPIHTVTLDSFYIGKYEITQAEWQRVMGSNPSWFSGDNRPVEKVSWYDIMKYCNLRSMAEGLTPCYTISASTDPADWITVPNNSNSTWNAAICNWNANGYRLPTEAEWEYACRGGNVSGDYLYSGSDTLADVGWYDVNSGDTTRDVGGKTPNELGIYDMSGNVYEWCWDWYGAYPVGPVNNPHGADNGSDRVLRGGGWYYDGWYCRCTYRGGNNPYDRAYNIGFRLVCVP